MRDVAITGVGAVCGLGWGVRALWDGLRAGRTAVRPIELFDASTHRTQLAAQVPPSDDAPRERTRTDGFAVFAAREAARHADLDADALRVAGVFFGSSTGGMFEAEDFYARTRERPRAAGGFTRLAAQLNGSPAEAVGRVLGACGPLETQSAACAAGAMALEAALRSVRAGETDIAIAGGADGLCELTYAGFNSLRAVDAEPCRPFRAQRAGLSMGEGAGVLVLEPLERARARGGRVLAVLAGAGASCDAHHMTAPDPEGRGAAAAMRAALRDADIAPGAVDFVNAHGTGTPHNDVAECAALRTVFGRTLPVTSSKAIFGHLLGASGALEAVATILCLEHGLVHPTPGAGDLEFDDLDVVVGEPRRLDRCATAVSTSLAFGGANAALVFEVPA